ncbi:hypothetical protein HR060_09210 [Catenovulum sp. SM1970]|nr:hypothetical protein [Marinifaba aquimaris]
MDASGRLATLSAVVSSIGLASGPMLASTLVTENNYYSMLFTCALLFALSLILMIGPVRKSAVSASMRQLKTA